jgi:class 3 adenylate cyclase
MPETQDELRPITALFADITGSTGLGERLAPDEVKALIGECVTRMSRAVEEYGGMVQAYQGDGICAYFGVPIAHEDDPERAARAALRIVEEMAAYARDAEQAWGISGLNVRVGLNTGPAAVGTVGAETPGMVALGDTTNVAARLESNAAAGTVAIGEATARRLTGGFTVEPLGPLAVKGRAEPVIAWRLVGAAPVTEAAPERPLFGRDSEQRDSAEAMAALVGGRGAVVVIGGDAGIGKTSLLRVMHRQATERVAWLEGHCRSYGGATFGPMADVIRSWLGVTDAEPDLAVRTRLRAQLGAEADALMPALSRILGIRLGPGAIDPLDGQPAQVVGEALRDGVLRWAELISADQPVVVAIDDAQWLDQPSTELLTELLALTDRLPLMVVLALRPESDSMGWTLRTRAMMDFAHRLRSIELGPISADAAGELAEFLAAGALDEATKRELIEMSEGNPLYLEELLATLMETGALERGRTWTLTVPAASILPPALEGLLLARVDRLPDPVRHIAQAAGVIGRSFPRPLLEMVASDDVDPAIGALLRSRIIVEQGRYPELVYEFRHGLLQQAAIATLTTSRRSDLHVAVARAIEERHADNLADRAEELAHHFGQGQDLGRALVYLEMGAERAAELGASEQAGRLWFRALRTANRIGDLESSERIRGRLGSIAES